MKSTRIHGLLVAGLGLCVGLALAAQAAAQSWTELSPTGGPPGARNNHTAVYDPASNQMIIFAGAFGNPHFNDVWSLSDANGLGISVWSEVFPGGGSPAPRFAHKAAYDEANDRMIVMGGGLGFSSPCANDVWVLMDASGTGGPPTWTQLAPSGALPAVRFGHSAVYDPVTNSLIVFGGSDCFTAPSYGGLWVLSNANGIGGTPAWTNPAQSGSPPGLLSSHTAVYDSVNNRMIVFGGLNPVITDRVWVLTNANGTGGTPTWSLLAPSGAAPPARLNHTAVYDDTANEMIVFGGTVPGFVNDVWVLSDANGIGTPTWTELLPSGTPPSARTANTAVFDPGSNRMTIFGGSNSGGFLNDVWVLELAADPICDVELNQDVYMTGDTVTADVFRVANPGADPRPIELKTWFEIPGLGPLSFLQFGADGSIVLSPGFDQDFGPITLQPVTAGTPPGSYEFDCRLLDPVTGKELALDVNMFEVQ